MLVKNTVKNLFVSCALMLSGVATCSKPVLANSRGYYTECSKKLMKFLSDILMDGEQVSPYHKCVSPSAVRKCVEQEKGCVDEIESKKKCWYC